MAADQTIKQSQQLLALVSAGAMLMGLAFYYVWAPMHAAAQLNRGVGAVDFVKQNLEDFANEIAAKDAQLGEDVKGVCQLLAQVDQVPG